MEDIWTKGENQSQDTNKSSFTVIVLQNKIRNELTYSVLNNINILADEIRNVYLQVPSSENNFILFGTKCFLNHVDKSALIFHTIYVREVSRKHFWNNLTGFMKYLGLDSIHSDTDVWMRSTVISDGRKYHG